jgi:cystathionine beta-lyase/cystathionine gamma-synthase
MGFSTDAIHAGQIPEPVTGAVTIPIFQTSTYVQEGIGKHKGYEYARTHNPTREALEKNLAVLEKGEHGICFASGLAATHAVIQTLQSGDHVLLADNLYGGTFRLLAQVMGPMGVAFDTVRASDSGAVAAAMKDHTRLFIVETPTNPMMDLVDLKAVSALCRERKIVFAVDNTFMTPYFQNPLELGADLVIHSTTKYLNGHSDMVGGAVVTSHGPLADKLRFLQNAAGAVPGPMDCWLALRGIKSLALRMEAHDRNARQVAAYLEKHSAVEKVIYPGLPSHPQHDLAKRQMRGFGGMVSALVGGLEEAKEILPRFKLFYLAESLGGIESLMCHPASMTHAAVPAEERAKVGLTEGLIRFSVGCEDIEDLLADIEQALA